MLTQREEELLLKSKLKTEERVINLKQIKMEMTYFDKIFMDATIPDQTKSLKLPFIKKKSGHQEFHSSRNSNHNNSQFMIAKDKTHEDAISRKEKSSSLISNALEKQNVKRNNDKSLENNKTMIQDDGSREESLKRHKRGLPKIVKNKYFKEFNEKMERIMSQRNVARVPEAVQQPKYKLGSVLGQGAYATVRLAKTDTGLLVAIKCYDKSKITDSEKLENIKREIQILRKLKHPLVLQLIDVTQNDTHINIVTELIQNMSILDLIKLNVASRLAEAEARPIFRELAQAVLYLHSKNIIHRDIKLQNVLFTRNKHIKLIDFGFSSEETSKLQTFCGTPSYISPEMIAKKGYGKSVDIWALGVTLYKMLCGHFPFKAVSHKALYSKISKGNFKFVTELSINVQILLSKMLCVEVSNRATIEQVLQEPWLAEGCDV